MNYHIHCLIDKPELMWNGKYDETGQLRRIDVVNIDN